MVLQWPAEDYSYATFVDSSCHPIQATPSQLFGAKRVVHVVATCDADGCEPPECEYERCVAQRAAEFDCLCPPIRAALRSYWSDWRPVSDNAATIAVDLRQGTGTIPCEAAVQDWRSNLKVDWLPDGGP